eukprot:m.184105 g.184105  ORF g.184105 m.184105 type:complete len:5153 (+) comp39317_c0_seq2:47-15505(+)
MAFMAIVTAVLLFCDIIGGQGSALKSEERTYSYSSITRFADKKEFALNGKFQVLCLERKDKVKVCQLKVESIQLRSPDVKEVPVQYGVPGGTKGHADMSKRFLFQELASGQISNVYHPTDENSDVLLLKKAFVSSVSASLQPSSLKYLVEETDHVGKHVATYEILGQTGGTVKYRKTKRPEGNQKYYYWHQKDIHYSNERGAVVFVAVNDTMRLLSSGRTEDPYKKNSERYSYTEDQPEVESGEFPNFHSGTNASARLVSLKSVSVRQTDFIVDGLIRGSIVAKPSNKKVAPKDYEDHIETAVACMAEKNSAESPDYRLCYGQLMDILVLLPAKLLSAVTNQYLSPKLLLRPSAETKAYLEGLASAATVEPLAQQLVLQRVLLAKDVQEEFFLKTLRLLFAIPNPSVALINKVRNLAFRPEKSPKNLRSADIVKTSTLLLGALGRAVDQSNETLSNGIAGELEDKLKASRISSERVTRSYDENFSGEEWHDRHYDQMMFIHSIGNAGSDRSRPILTYHLNGTNVPSILRRAAAHALGQYKCRQSAGALLSALSFEEEESVWDEALRSYTTHPLRDNATLAEHFSQRFIRGTNFKRRNVEDILKKLNFKLELPTLDWKKQIGSSSLGASFGVYLKNKMELKTESLITKFETVLRNEGWLTGHLGIIGTNFDIVKAKACYHGHVDYDLNFLKDFDIEKYKNLAKAFQNIVGSVSGEIQNAVDAFKKIICKGCLENIFQNFVDVLVDIPRLLMNFQQTIRDIQQKLAEFVDVPFTAQVQSVMQRAKALVDAVQSDFLAVYKDVNDVIAIDLPYAASVIRDAFDFIGQLIEKLFKSPGQSMSKISKAEGRVKGAVAVILSTKEKLKNAFKLGDGRAPLWLNFQREWTSLSNDAVSVYNEMKAILSDRAAKVKNLFAKDGPFSLESQEFFVAQTVEKVFKGVFNPLEALGNLTAPFLNAYDSVSEAVVSVKNAYTDFKDLIANGKSLLIGVFGPKFDPKFLNKRRPCESDPCGCGLFPTTGGGSFDKGVDLLAAKGEEIVSPISGTAFVSNHQITIRGNQGSFSDKTVIIDNIDGDPAFAKRRSVFAGDLIGTAGTASYCSLNSIHVTVKETGDGSIVDPSSYLYSLTVPRLKWIQECDEYSLVVAGVTISSGRLSDAARRFVEDIKRGKNPFEGVGDKLREAVKTAGSKIKNAYNETKKAISDAFNDVKDFFNGDSIEKALEAKFSFDGVDLPSLDLSTFKVDFGTFLSSLDLNAESLIPKIQSLGSLLGFDIGGTTALSMMDSLKDADLKKTYSVLNDLLQKLKAAIENPLSTCQNPQTMSTEQLQATVEKQNHPTSGSRESLLKKLLQVPNTVCSFLKSAIPSGSGHYCSIAPDCLEINCCLQVKFLQWTKHIKAGVRFDKCKSVVEISFASWKKEYDIRTSFEKKVSVDKLFGVGISVDLSLKLFANSTTITVSLDGEVCAVGLGTCTPKSWLLRDLVFDIAAAECKQRKRSAADLIDTLKKLPLTEIQKKLAAFNINGTVTSLLSQSSKALLNKLRSKAVSALGKFAEEFPQVVDFCKSGSLNFPTISNTFFYYSVTYPIGPVFLTFFIGSRGAYSTSLSYEACFLKMEGKVQVTPWAGLVVYGGAKVTIFIFAVELSIHGHIVDTQFPAMLSIKFSKMPLKVGGRMDLVLVPLRVEIWVAVKIEIRICFFVCISFSKTIWSSRLWSYQAPSITSNIFTIGNLDHDYSPPSFSPLSNVDFDHLESRRSLSDMTCRVDQTKGLFPSEPQFALETAATDDESDVKFSFSVGTYRGGNNIKKSIEMGGPKLVSSAYSFPSGIPLYFTITARNTEGLTADSQCLIPTYDTTLPSGRVEQSFDVSTNPFHLSAFFVAHDDSVLKNSGRLSIGLGTGTSNVVPWHDFSYKAIAKNEDAQDNLQHFASPRAGLLSSVPVAKTTVLGPQFCASFCLSRTIECVSFDYDYDSKECRVQKTIEGPNTKLRVFQSFYNFERIGVGHSTWLEYRNLSLEHGKVYRINTRVENVLEYSQLISSKGTLIDFTPPHTALILNAKYNVTTADGCSASIKQKSCTEVTPWPNHRIIVDGKGSLAVFNGHVPFEDKLYTRYNNFISGNFRGFYDNDAGISAYTWSAGRSVLSQDVLPYRDPHGHLPDQRHWTNAPIELLHLDDGAYFLTVQAVNDVDSGGSLVATVGHSTPLLVDTVPPLVHGIHGLHFNETSTLLTLDYNVSDSGSGVREVDFGIGKTIHDNFLRHWTRYGHGEKSQLRILVSIPDGVPAWVRLRAIDNVYLMATGHSNKPLLLDHSPPVAGFVNDGKNRGFDLKFTAESNQYCFNWDDFHDADSGINAVAFAGVGSTQGSFDIVGRKSVAYYQKSVCFSVRLQHNVKYFATLEVSNDANKPLTVNSSSDGVLVDVTPAKGGIVRDGSVLGSDWDYSYDQTAIYSNWDGFFDNESSIVGYEVQSIVSGKKLAVQSVDFASASTHSDVSAHVQHGNRIVSIISAINGAGIKTTLTTDGYVIDATPPELLTIRFVDAIEGEPFYQSVSDSVKAAWSYQDLESGIKEYRVGVHEIKFGSTFTVYPVAGDWIDFPKQGKDGDINTYWQKGLKLANGAQYVVKVMAINRAELSAIHDTEPATIDTSPPVMRYVVVGTLNPEDEEDVDSNGRIIHAGQSSIPGNWLGGDRDSGIASYLVAIGTKRGSSDASNGWRDMGSRSSGLIDGLSLSLTDPKPGSPLYYMSVKARNRAGLESAPVVSNPIFVVKADVAGIATDGETNIDADYQRHGYAVTAHFSGYESERCGGMAGYVWAIGSSPSQANIQPFTMEGLAVYGNGSGAAQMPMDLNSGDTVYCTIKATTKCGNNLQSASNGITIDTKKPAVSIVSVASSSRENDSQILYQRTADSLGFSWSGNDSESGIREYFWWAGSYPFDSGTVNATASIEESTPPGVIKSVTEGVPTYFSLLALDNVGYNTELVSAGVAVDVSPPLASDFRCPSAVSTMADSIKCCWDPFTDEESGITYFGLMMGDLPGSSQNGGPLSVPLTESCAELVFSAGQARNKTCVITVEAKNGVGLKTSASRLLTIDSTAPVGGHVNILRDFYLNSPSDSAKAVECQRSEKQIHIAWNGFKDRESSIAGYEVGIGTVTGAADVYPFTSVGLETSVAIQRIFMSHGSKIYASVNAINVAGLTTTVTSDAVIISSSPRVSVLDGLGEEDIDFQFSSRLLSAAWSVDDSCSLASVSWSIHRIDGHQILPLTQLTSSSTSAIQENLRLDSGEMYYVIVKITNTIGITSYGRSDGVTVDVDGPVPGQVFDGIDDGVDSNYQPSVTTLGVNWAKFGDQSSMSPSQQVAFYEVALGTDDRYFLARQNVVPFVTVGLNRSIVFENLELTPRTQKYFFTIRAMSQTGVTVESTSNGIFVGFGDSPSAGVVETNPFTNRSTTISSTWDKFSSSIPLLFYEWAIATKPPRQVECPSSISDRATKNVSAAGGTFVQDFVRVGLDTFATNTRLSLVHNQRYYVVVRATNEALKCVWVVSNSVLVDLTPPATITVGVGYANGLHVRYSTSSDSLQAEWGEISDKESGIFKYEVGLFKKTSCTGTQSVKPNELATVREYFDVYNGTSYQFTGLSILPNEPHFVQVVAHNKAGSRSLSTSLPVLLDTSVPTAGDVKDGLNWTEDVVFQSSLSQISGVLTLARSKVDMICPNRFFNFSSLARLPNDWKLFDPSGLKDINTYDSVIYDSKQVTLSDRSLKFGFVRDRGSTKVRSSLAYTDIRIFDGASIDVTMKAAPGKDVVTPVVIWGGPEGTLGDFELQNPTRDSQQIEEVFQGSASGSSGFASDTNAAPTRQSNTSRSADLPTEEKFSAASASLGFHVYGESFLDDDVWYLAFWCRFHGDQDRPKIDWIELDFDPTVEFHRYTLNFLLQQEEGDLDSAVELHVDGSLRSVLTGIPSLSANSRFTLGVRTRFGYVPPLPDPFDPPDAYASVSQLRLPSARAEVCHFGKPFYDLESRILSLEACVTSTSDGSSCVCDVAPYTRLSLPCTPCLDSCDLYNCMIDCPTNSTLAVLPFTLHNLPLSVGSAKNDSHSNEGDFVAPSQYFDPSTYYLQVRIRNGAGQTSVSVSSGVVIDTTPPDCAELHQVDASWSMTEPVLFQGNNNSLAAFWECSDNISGIVQYFWNVVIQKTTDVVAQGSLRGKDKSVVARNVTLRQKEVYVFTLVAKNGAGLKSAWKGAGITVDIESPDLRNASFNVRTGEGVSVVDSAQIPSRTRKIDEIGFEWKNLHDDDIGAIEMAIGFTPDGEEVLPKVQVSYTKNGSYAVIRNGKLFVGRGAGQNLSEIAAVLRQSTKAYSEDYMFLEPGRVVYATLVANSKSHIESRIHSPGLLVMREGDKLVPNSRNSQTVALEGPLSYTFASDREGKLKFSNATIADAVELSNIRVRVGGFVAIGRLSWQDMNIPYGSSAVLDYHEYIKDPDSSKSLTSRLLTKRINNWLGTSFYVAPLSKGDVEGPIHVKVKFNTSLIWSEDIPDIIYWSAAERMWFLAAENSCVDNSTIDWTSGVVSVSVCLTWDNAENRTSRAKRSASESFLSQPTQFAVVKIDSKFQNTAPILPDRVQFSVKEDDVLKVQLDYVDGEGDTVLFSLINNTDMGELSLASSGLLTFSPCFNCEGRILVAYRITEESIPLGDPLSTVALIEIEVKSLQDPPLLFYYTDGMEYPKAVTADLTVDVTFEQSLSNSTEIIYWTAVFDPDTEDHVKFKHEENGQNLFNLTSSSNNWLTSQIDFLKNYSTISLEKPVINSSILRYVAAPNFTGMDEIRFLGYDQNFAYTNLLSVRLYGLINPCSENGECNATGNDACNSIQRAFSWDGYNCACFPGYTGVLCQTDIDECKSSPCATGYDCVNLVDAFECKMKASVVAAIAVCSVVSVVAVAIIAVVIILRKNRKVKRDKVAKRQNPNVYLSSFPQTSTSIPLQFLSSHCDEEIGDRAIQNQIYVMKRSDHDEEQEHVEEKGEEKENWAAEMAVYSSIEELGDSKGKKVSSDPNVNLTSLPRESMPLQFFFPHFDGKNSDSVRVVQNPVYGMEESTNETKAEQLNEEEGEGETCEGAVYSNIEELDDEKGEEMSDSETGRSDDKPAVYSNVADEGKEGTEVMNSGNVTGDEPLYDQVN